MASAGAFFVLFMLIVEGPPRPYDTPIELMGFLLTFYTFPVVAFYLGGLVVGCAASIGRSSGRDRPVRLVVQTNGRREEVDLLVVRRLKPEVLKV